MNEIVHCKDSQDMPRYLLKDTTFDATGIFKTNSVMARHSLVDLEHDINRSILDSSQQRALLSSLMNPLSIIQGPPGCGKTFIGSILVKLLLCADPAPRLPILLLTYKNHALDEFLKDSLNFLQLKDIARIGGRSKEEKLDPCNLKELKKTSPKNNTLQKINS